MLERDQKSYKAIKVLYTSISQYCVLKFPNQPQNTLCEEHRVDFDSSSIFEPVRQLREEETLKVEADLQGLAGALHLV